MGGDTDARGDMGMEISARKVAQVILMGHEIERAEGELRAFIDRMNEDEQAELTAIYWIGRGSFRGRGLGRGGRDRTGRGDDADGRLPARQPAFRRPPGGRGGGDGHGHHRRGGRPALGSTDASRALDVAFGPSIRFGPGAAGGRGPRRGADAPMAGGRCGVVAAAAVFPGR